MAFKKGDYVVLLEDEPHGAVGTYRGDILKIHAVDLCSPFNIRAKRLNLETGEYGLRVWFYKQDILINLGSDKTIPRPIKALYGF